MWPKPIGATGVYRSKTVCESDIRMNHTVQIERLKKFWEDMFVQGNITG